MLPLTGYKYMLFNPHCFTLHSCSCSSSRSLFPLSSSSVTLPSTPLLILSPSLVSQFLYSLPSLHLLLPVLSRSLSRSGFFPWHLSSSISVMFMVQTVVTTDSFPIVLLVLLSKGLLSTAEALMSGRRLYGRWRGFPPPADH